MSGVSAVIMIGSPHSEGISPSHYLFINENDRPSLTLFNSNVSQNAGSEKIATWIPTIENTADDIMLMICRYIVEDPEIIEKIESYFKTDKSGYAELYNIIDKDHRFELYRTVKEIMMCEDRLKIVVTVLEHSMILKHVNVFSDYHINSEICISSPHLKQQGTLQYSSEEVFYFAYGSNMDEKRLNERIYKYPKKSQLAILHDYKLMFNKTADIKKGSGYANIIPEKGGVVEGILYTLDSSDILNIDEHEGIGTHYLRRLIDVKTAKGKIVKAYVYKALNSQVNDELKPTKEYLNYLLSFRARQLLSKEYIASLEKVDTID